MVAEISLGLQLADPESVGMLPNVRRDMRPLVRLLRLLPCGPECLGREGFRVQSEWERSLHGVARIVCIVFVERRDDTVHNLRVEEGAVGGDPYHLVRPVLPCGGMITVEDVLWIPTEGRNVKAVTLPHDGVIRLLRRRGNHKGPEGRCVARMGHDACEHRLVSDRLQDLPRKPRAAHPGLDDRDRPHAAKAWRTSSMASMTRSTSASESEAYIGRLRICSYACSATGHSPGPVPNRLR